MSEITFEGRIYAVPEHEPPQNRRRDDLHPFFDKALDGWHRAAQDYIRREYGTFTNAEKLQQDSITLYQGEGRRDEARQAYLYGVGRAIRLGEKILSSTMNSKHRYGLASDLYAIDNETGGLVWDDGPGEFWDDLLTNVPPRAFGLTDIRPFELVHLELVIADDLISQSERYGVVFT